MTEERIGVYVCHCGTNISSVVDVEEVAEWAKETLGEDGVTVARDYKFMCSSLGQELIQDDIKEKGINRVVVAACSPHLHEQTFRTACDKAGLNPYLCEMVSVREQVSWVTTDKELATQKAKAMVAGGVERVIQQEPLEPLHVPINEATLVVGAGIAGIQAAIEIADSGFPVYLVEREPSVGGHMAQFDKTFPTLDCAACILTPKMVTVGSHPNIHLLSYSEVERVDGYVGNFTVTIRKKARYVNEDVCTGCGICIEKCPKTVIDDVFEAGLGYRKAIYRPFPQAVPKYPVIDMENCTYFQRGKCKACQIFCPTQPNSIDFEQEDELLQVEVGNIILATGYDLFDPRRIPQYGYGRLANVFTSLEFERMCNASGPTNGDVVLRDGVTQPESVAVIHCVGSRDRNYNEHCSVICCMQSLKFAHLVKERTGAEVYNFYIDMRTAFKDYDEFYQKVLSEGVHFIRGRVAEVT
ncbi:MAG TPA: CoB--CoM heterodisulfide reductase iron-sulfur subunit A family protein, partial [Chloroflexi bacterium]|nr:CoB--CoM heterodisulfide reductase iron-sulfur subunit A family protein [Chloroflexota bacterium]